MSRPSSTKADVPITELVNRALTLLEQFKLSASSTERSALHEEVKALLTEGIPRHPGYVDFVNRNGVFYHSFLDMQTILAHNETALIESRFRNLRRNSHGSSRGSGPRARGRRPSQDLGTPGQTNGHPDGHVNGNGSGGWPDKGGALTNGHGQANGFPRANGPSHGRQADSPPANPAGQSHGYVQANGHGQANGHAHTNSYARYAGPVQANGHPQANGRANGNHRASGNIQASGHSQASGNPQASEAPQDSGPTPDSGQTQAHPLSESRAGSPSRALPYPASPTPGKPRASLTMPEPGAKGSTPAGSASPPPALPTSTAGCEISPAILYNKMKVSKVLVIDLRPSEQYSAGHVNAALLTNLEPASIRAGMTDFDMQDALVISDPAEFDSFGRRHEVDLICVYDARSTQVADAAPLAPAFAALRSAGLRPYLLRGGFEAWQRQYPQEVVPQRAASPASLVSAPAPGPADRFRAHRVTPPLPVAPPPPVPPLHKWAPRLPPKELPRLPQLSPPDGAASQLSPPHRAYTAPATQLSAGPADTGVPFGSTAFGNAPLVKPPIGNGAFGRSPASSRLSFGGGHPANGSQPLPGNPYGGFDPYGASTSNLSYGGITAHSNLSHGLAHGSGLSLSSGAAVGSSPGSSHGSLSSPSDRDLPSLPPPVPAQPPPSFGTLDAPKPKAPKAPTVNGYTDAPAKPLMSLRVPKLLNNPSPQRNPSPNGSPYRPGSDLARSPSPVRLSPPQLATPPYMDEVVPPNLLSNTGLKNLGNTCYMNCVIQCLVSFPRLVEPFNDGSFVRYVNHRSRLGTQGQLAAVFSDLVRSIFQPYPGTGAVVAPYTLKNMAGQMRPDDFGGYEQQDCQEFLTFILDGLHEDLNSNGDKRKQGELNESEEKIREQMGIRAASAVEWERYLEGDTSLIVDLFQGQYLSRLQCMTCRHTSTTYNAFSSLSLPLVSPKLLGQHTSLKACFDEFVKPEILLGDNAWYCPHCKTKRRTVKTLQISRLPPILVIHLKRFKRTSSGVNKLETPVDYPVRGLDLTRYWPQSQQHELSAKEAEILAEIPSRGQNAPFIYDLRAVTLHHGTLKGGHYTAVVQKPGRGWLYYDDANVTPIKEQAAVSKNAYVLFYRRRM